MKEIQEVLQFLEESELYPDLKVVGNSAEPEINMNGEKKILFSSNNYLGLASHPKMIEAGVTALKQFGTGSGGSRMLSGNFDLHNEAENALANYKGAEAAIIYSSGYAANVGVIPALASITKFRAKDFLRRKTVIFSDELNHASIIDGCKLSNQEIVVYKHNNVKDLERLLKKHRLRRKLIITDGVFSMDGDIAPLDKIAELAKKYKALTMIDDAHATGMLGPKGKGSCDYFGLTPGKDIDIIMGTLSKAIGAQGGYVVGNADTIKYIRVLSRSQVFSTAVTPSISATVIAAMNLLKNDPTLREQLWENTNYLKTKLHTYGFNTMNSVTQIVPIFIGKEEMAIKASRRLYEEGIFAPCVRWPAVPKKEARLRLTVMASHKKEHLDYLIDKLLIVGREFKII